MGWREVGIESMRWLRAWEQWLFKLTWTVLYNLLKLRSGTSALHLFFFTCWPSSSTLVSSQTEWHVTGWIQRGQQIHLPLVEPLIGHIALPWPLHYRQQTHRCISHALTPQVQHAEPSTFFHLVPSEMADANTIMLLTSTHRQCHPALPGLARATSLSLTAERLCLVGVCGQVVRVAHSDSEVMWETLIWHKAVITNNFLSTFSVDLLISRTSSSSQKPQQTARHWSARQFRLKPFFRLIWC